MRRSEKAVTDPQQLEEIIRAGRICRLALAAEPAPYIVPLNYGFAEGVLYFHCAAEGRKIELLQQNPQVGFEIDIDLGLRQGESACHWGARYRCVIGHGRVEFVEGSGAKRRALDLLMAQYAEGEFDYPEKAICETTIFKLVIAEMTGKQAGV